MYLLNILAKEETRSLAGNVTLFFLGLQKGHSQLYCFKFLKLSFEELL